VGAGLDQSDVRESPSRGDFTVREGLLPVLAIDDVLEVAGQGALIDARSPERYRGEVEPIDPVAGHVPGAVNVPSDANLTENGRFRSPGELRELYAVAAGGPAAVYCGSGVTAAHDILAMRVAGLEAALYPGSWSEWVTDDGGRGQRPVAAGPEPGPVPPRGSTATTASTASGP
jgi:thiosulfate/3-mercaptopyruvate sulfurtransferase